MNRYDMALGKKPPPTKLETLSPYFMGLDVGIRTPTEIVLCHMGQHPSPPNGPKNYGLIIDYKESIRNVDLWELKDKVVKLAIRFKERPMKIRCDNNFFDEVQYCIEAPCDSVHVNKYWENSLRQECSNFNISTFSSSLSGFSDKYRVSFELALSLALEYIRTLPENKSESWGSHEIALRERLYDTLFSR